MSSSVLVTCNIGLRSLPTARPTRYARSRSPQLLGLDLSAREWGSEESRNQNDEFRRDDEARNVFSQSTVVHAQMPGSLELVACILSNCFWAALLRFHARQRLCDAPSAKRRNKQHCGGA